METVDQEDLIRERDFYRAKLADAKNRIKSLELENAALQKREQNLSGRLSEVTKKNSNFRPRNNRRG